MRQGKTEPSHQRSQRSAFCRIQFFSNQTFVSRTALLRSVSSLPISICQSAVRNLAICHKAALSTAQSGAYSDAKMIVFSTSCFMQHPFPFAKHPRNRPIGRRRLGRTFGQGALRSSPENDNLPYSALPGSGPSDPMHRARWRHRRMNEIAYKLHRCSLAAHAGLPGSAGHYPGRRSTNGGHTGLRKLPCGFTTPLAA